MFATGTFAENRSFVWMPAFASDANGWDGTLTMSQETGVRIRRTITDRYSVEEQRPGGFPGRVFLVCKERHAGDLDTVAGRKSAERLGEVYQCSIGHSAAGPRYCTCTGFVTRTAPIVCKHIRTLSAAIEQGAIEPRF